MQVENVPNEEMEKALKLILLQGMEQRQQLINKLEVEHGIKVTPELLEKWEQELKDVQ